MILPRKSEPAADDRRRQRERELPGEVDGLAGAQQLTPVAPDTGGQYEVTLPPGSAAMLALSPAAQSADH